MEITVLKDIFESNAQVANEIKELLKKKNIFMIDMMGSPGGGKTTVTDRIVNTLKGRYRIAIIEADISTTKDAEKLAKHDIPIVQIETNLYGGECHVESTWVHRSLEKFDLDSLDLVIIENVGNLVCPAEFELGDDIRIVVLSLTEGEDKPAKYPLMFRTSQTVILNKIDLLPHLNYNMDEVKKNIKSVNPDMKIFEASAIKGDGFDSFLNYLTGLIDKKIK